MRNTAITVMSKVDAQFPSGGNRSNPRRQNWPGAIFSIAYEECFRGDKEGVAMGMRCAL